MFVCGLSVCGQFVSVRVCDYAPKPFCAASYFLGAAPNKSSVKQHNDTSHSANVGQGHAGTFRSSPEVSRSEAASAVYSRSGIVSPTTILHTNENHRRVCGLTALRFCVVETLFPNPYVLIGFLFRKINRNYGHVRTVSMSLNRRCTLASIRRSMILPAFLRTTGSRFHLLRRGASMDAGVGVRVCVRTGCSPRAYLFKRFGSHLAASSKMPTLDSTQAIVGMASICGPTILGAHISQLIGHISLAVVTALILASTLPTRVFTPSPNSHSASVVIAFTSIFTTAATCSSVFCANNHHC